MSEPIRCIKATTASIKDPKMLAVLKASVGSPIYYHGKFDSHNMFGCGVYLTGFVVKIFHDQNYFIIHNDYDGSAKRQDEILIPIHSIKLEPRLLIGEGVKVVANDYVGELVEFSNNEFFLYDSCNNDMEPFGSDSIKITEETLKEIGFEVVEVEE